MTSPGAGVLPSSVEWRHQMEFYFDFGWPLVSIHQVPGILTCITSQGPCNTLLRQVWPPPNMQDSCPWGAHSLAWWHMTVTKRGNDKRWKSEQWMRRFERGGDTCLWTQLPIALQIKYKLLFFSCKDLLLVSFSTSFQAVPSPHSHFPDTQVCQFSETNVMSTSGPAFAVFPSAWDSCHFGFSNGWLNPFHP